MHKLLPKIAPHFIEMAHHIGICVAATTDASGRPRTRVVQPVWEWDGTSLTGWVSSTTDSPKMDDLRKLPLISLTYWNSEQDTCTADCHVEFIEDDAERANAWERFKSTPPPAGFDPAIHPDWDTPAAPTFGVLRLTPRWLRVMPGSLMTEGVGEVWTWRDE